MTFLRRPRFKFLERGFGIRNKIAHVSTIIDQRRLDGTRTKTGDFLLKKTRDLLHRFIVDPGIDKRKNQHARQRKKVGDEVGFTWETIEEERKKLEK